jgi:hypothetical protein
MIYLETPNAKIPSRDLEGQPDVALGIEGDNFSEEAISLACYLLDTDEDTLRDFITRVSRNLKRRNR